MSIHVPMEVIVRCDFPIVADLFIAGATPKPFCKLQCNLKFREQRGVDVVMQG